MARTAAVTASAATPLFFHFLMQPPVDMPGALIIFSLWAASAAADLHVTLAHGRYIRDHEQSVILSAVHARFPRSPRMTAAVTAAAEAACVLLLPVLAVSTLDVGASMAVAHLFSVLHASAVLSNDGFVRRNGRHRRGGGGMCRRRK